MSALAFGTLLGGIGLFLLGMSLMTDSLTALGGRALRGLLRRLTRRPFQALLAGAGATTILQSSSATTLVTVGFVSAGLLTFSDSLALIFGANLGTTSTAWIVSLVGLKVKVSALALPLVGVGALVRLVSRGRRARLGLAVAGFGLIFVGIDVMQSGMALVDLDLTEWSSQRGFTGTLILVGVGAVMTVVMQSSSAAVATTLIALNAGTLTIHQAAALVIGQNVGTTVSAILGAAGGRLAARRAAVAHTLFNIGTGAVAVALLDPFIAAVRAISAQFASESPEITIAIFHTAFNLLGVALFFPFSGRFARAVERIVPERGTPGIEQPSTAMLQVPALALEAARSGAAKTAREALALAIESLRRVKTTEDDVEPWRRALSVIADPREILTGEDHTTRALVARLEALRAAVDAITEYLGRIRTHGQAPGLREEHVELVHAVDNMRRLVRTIENVDTMDVVHAQPELRQRAGQLIDELDPIAQGIPPLPDVAALDVTARALEDVLAAEKDRMDDFRGVILARLADGDLTALDTDATLGGSRWLGKIPKYALKSFRHLAWTHGSPALPEEPEE